MQNEFVTFLTAYSALIQALATVVLVVLTIYYVRQVHRSANEMAENRKVDFLPMVTVRMQARDPRTLEVYLSNIGRGIAQYPVVKLPFEEPVSVGEAISPGQENVLATFSGVGISELLELADDERVLTVEYGDIFGRIIKTEAFLKADEPVDGELKKETVAVRDWRVVLPGDQAE